jgi:hypothetical protein
MKAPTTDLYCGGCTCKELGRSSCYAKFFLELLADRTADKLRGKWIGVDLDGTLAHDGVDPVMGIGAPVPLMVARVRAWVAAGIEVRIVTARCSPDRYDFPDTAEQQRHVVQAWLVKHVGVQLTVQAHKDHLMHALYDDRAVRIERNTGALA